MENYVKIINIIDKSGSMSSIKESTITGFNEFLSEQKNIIGNALITTILFDSKYNKLYEDVDIKECEYLTINDYKPSSMTALYDAIFITINNEIDKLAFLPLEKRPNKTLCLILTDGEENASKKCNSEIIKKMITEMKSDYNWEFVFLGANQDVFLSAKNIGISSGNSYSFNTDNESVSDTFRGMSYATKSYRTSNSVSLDNIMDEYNKKK